MARFTSVPLASFSNSENGRFSPAGEPASPAPPQAASAGAISARSRTLTSLLVGMVTPVYPILDVFTAVALTCLLASVYAFGPGSGTRPFWETSERLHHAPEHPSRVQVHHRVHPAARQRVVVGRGGVEGRKRAALDRHGPRVRDGGDAGYVPEDLL